MKKVESREMTKDGMSKIFGGGVEPLKNDATYVAPKKYYPPIKRQ